MALIFETSTQTIVHRSHNVFILVWLEYSRIIGIFLNSLPADILRNACLALLVLIFLILRANSQIVLRLTFIILLFLDIVCLFSLRCFCSRSSIF